MNLFPLVLAMCFVIRHANCKMNLRIDFQMFTNLYGVKYDRKCCFDNDVDSVDASTAQCPRKCSTFFRVCLSASMTVANGNNCIETGIIGENSINPDQFRLGVDSIRFQAVPMTSYLSVDVFNDESADAQYTDKKRQLISKWSDRVDMTQLNQTHGIDKYNQSLNQHLKMSYKFECANGYSGADCSIVSCLTGCNTKNGAGYCSKPNECICTQGWSGKYCDRPDTVALSTCQVDCKNGGSCVFDRKFNKDYCDCSATGYDGQFCEVKIQKMLCNSTYLCLHGGTCLHDGQCLCAPGYSGDRCQIATTVSQCGPQTCLNGGTCVINNDNQYECVCTASHTGRFCEITKDICLDNNPCLNGGTCKWNQVESSHTCTCGDGVFGRNCEFFGLPKAFKSMQNATEATPSENNEIGLKTTEIMLVVCLGVGVPLTTLAILSVICKIYSNRRVNRHLKKMQLFTTTTASPSSTSLSLPKSTSSGSMSSTDAKTDVEKQLEPTESAKISNLDEHKQTIAKQLNFIQNNLFVAGDDHDRKEKYLTNKKINLNVCDRRNVVENEIYLNFNTFQEHIKQHKSSDSFNIMASIV